MALHSASTEKISSVHASRSLERPADELGHCASQSAEAGATEVSARNFKIVCNKTGATETNPSEAGRNRDPARSIADNNP